MRINVTKALFAVCLAILAIFSFSLRIYKVDTIPSGIHADEASIGYNAYSILKTGKDEHGISYPIIFKAFGDQKLPAYVYSVVPFIKLFGLNNLAIRFPAVLVGTMITIGIFFLMLELGFSKKLSFLGAFITATTPWQIFLSRIYGYESNMGLLFFILGIIFSFKTIRKEKIIYAILSGCFYALTWYSYVAYRIVTPTILLYFLVLNFKRTRLFIVNRIGMLSAFLVIILPLIYLTLAGQGVARFSQVRSTSDAGIILNVNDSRAHCTRFIPKILCYLNSNKVMANAQSLITRYNTTFSLDYLFINGERESKFLTVDNFGQFLLILAPFYLLGLLYLGNNLIKNNLTSKDIFLIMGLIIAPLPSILVSNPQMVRLSPLYPFILIIILYGFSQTIVFTKKLISPQHLLVIELALIGISSVFFMINLLNVHIPKYESIYGNYIPPLMRYLYIQDKNTKTYIQSIEEGIEFYAYVNKIDPTYFQNEVVRDKPNDIGFAHAKNLENIYITQANIYETYCKNGKNTMYVTNENLQDKVGKAVKIFTSYDGTYKLMFVYDLRKPQLLTTVCPK